MEPLNIKFGGGVSQTILHPAVAIVVVIAGLVVLLAPRSRAIAAFLALGILIPVDQVLLIGPLHFSMLRVLAGFGCLRMLRARASSTCRVLNGGWNALDTAVVVLAVSSAINGMLLWQVGAAVVKQLGDLYTVCGVYFSLRHLIRDEADAVRTIRMFAYIATVVAIVMVYEHAVGSNPYALLDGAKSDYYASVMERDAHLRATGCFAHPILAGTFGAVLLPWFFGLWWTSQKNRKYAAVGMVAATIITVASSSSTSVGAYIAGIIALCMWPLRKHMRIVRWSILFMLISLHIVMKAPVWHLISRIDLAGGSSSYHRYQLVNQFILHWADWWLIGTKSYADWGWDMWDLSNQYVAIGETAGLLPLICFVATIAIAFKYVGRARRWFAGRKNHEMFIWANGAALCANVVAFFGISYFDQTILAWYALLSVIPATTLVAMSGCRKKEMHVQTSPLQPSLVGLDHNPKPTAPFCPPPPFALDLEPYRNADV